MPFDDWPPGVLQSLLPVLESRFVFFVLAPAKLDLSNWVPATDKIVITNLKVYISYNLIELKSMCEMFLGYFTDLPPLDDIIYSKLVSFFLFLSVKISLSTALKRF